MLNKTRDPKRIKPFLEKVEELWIEHPDYRFGQIIYLIMCECRDGFYIEEPEWTERIDKILEKGSYLEKFIKEVGEKKCDTQV